MKNRTLQVQETVALSGECSNSIDYIYQYR